MPKELHFNYDEVCKIIGQLYLEIEYLKKVNSEVSRERDSAILAFTNKQEK